MTNVWPVSSRSVIAAITAALSTFAAVPIASAQSVREVGYGVERSHAELAARAIQNVCQPAAVSNETARRHVDLMGYKRSSRRTELSWALPQDADVWEVEESKRSVLVFVYGPGHGICGVLAPRESSERIMAALAASNGYRIISEMELDWGVHSTSMQSEWTGDILDILDYPASGVGPGLVKIELLPN